MVGNMSDMQADTPTMQYIPQMFCRNMTPTVNNAAKTANVRNSNPELKKRNKNVQMKRLTQNTAIAAILNCCERTSAACSAMPIDMKRRVPY